MRRGNGAMVPLVPSLQLRAVQDQVLYLIEWVFILFAGDNKPKPVVHTTVVHTLPLGKLSLHATLW